MLVTTDGPDTKLALKRRGGMNILIDCYKSLLLLKGEINNIQDPFKKRTKKENGFPYLFKRVRCMKGMISVCLVSKAVSVLELGLESVTRKRMRVHKL